MTDPLRLACIDSDAPPLFGRIDELGARRGFEPAIGELVAGRMHRTVRWVPMPWEEMLPRVAGGDVDAVLCGQGITAAREEIVHFTRPYAIFHESVLVRRGSGITRAEQLRGRKVAAIAGSTNMALAKTFDGAQPVPFGGNSDDVYHDMLDALGAGAVDAVVDDDVVFVPLGAGHPDYELAFTVPTGNRWGIGVAKDRTEMCGAIDAALVGAVVDGSHHLVWQEWLPTLDYPFAQEVGTR